MMQAVCERLENRKKATLRKKCNASDWCSKKIDNRAKKRYDKNIKKRLGVNKK